MDAVSSPSDLGTRGGVSTGTPVDPWMVRAIKGTFGQVAWSVLRELSSFDHKRQKGTHVAVSSTLCTNRGVRKPCHRIYTMSPMVDGAGAE